MIERQVDDGGDDTGTETKAVRAFHARHLSRLFLFFLFYLRLYFRRCLALPRLLCSFFLLCLFCCFPSSTALRCRGRVLGGRFLTNRRSGPFGGFLTLTSCLFVLTNCLSAFALGRFSPLGSYFDQLLFDVLFL